MPVLQEALFALRFFKFFKHLNNLIKLPYFNGAQVDLELFNFFFRFYIALKIFLGMCPVPFILPVLCHHNYRGSISSL